MQQHSPKHVFDSPKGQTMSKCTYEIIDFPKYHWKNLIDFCPGRFYRLGTLESGINIVRGKFGKNVSIAPFIPYTYITKIAKARPHSEEWQTDSSVQKQWSMAKHCVDLNKNNL